VTQSTSTRLVIIIHSFLSFSTKKRQKQIVFSSNDMCFFVTLFSKKQKTEERRNTTWKEIAKMPNDAISHKTIQHTLLSSI
jgi:hypothetical protein